MREVLADLSNKIIKKGLEKGIEELEFYGRWTREYRVSISRNHVKAFINNEIIEYGVLGSIGKKIGSIGSQDLDIDVDKLVEQLASIIKSSREDPSWRGFAKNYGKGIEAPGYDKELAEIEPDKIIEIMSHTIDTAIDSAKKLGADETIVSEGGYTVVVGGVYIANSNNEEQYGEYTYHGMFYEVKSRKGGEESSFGGYVANRRLDLSEIEKEARRAGEYSIKFMQAKPVESGEYQVLLDPYMTALFISTVLEPAFSALSVQEKRSPLRGKIGEKILSENIEIYDDPTIEWGIGTRPFDDEGIATTKKALVEKGVLKTYLYNYYTAMRENRASTGNGMRRTPSSPTTPSATNFVVKGLDNLMDEDEMVKEIKKGLVVHGMIGYWMSNEVNGATQATVSHGLFVENGEIVRAVKGVVIGGNIYSWLGENLLGISKKIYKLGSTYTPAILVDKVRIAG